MLPRSGLRCEVLAPRFVEYGHHLLVGACFLVAQTGWLLVLKPLAAEGQAGMGCLAGGKAVLPGTNTDRQLAKISAARNALRRRSLNIKRFFFSFTPGSTTLSANPANASCGACCLVLWLSLPAACPYGSKEVVGRWVQVSSIE